MDESLECSQGGNQQQGKQMQKSAAATAAALSCPRCDSTNTKFCYYNNYSKLQPRHYCRACRRHWTEGGTLRNVPVGGSRKNKRLRTNQATSADAAADDGGSVDGGGGYLTPEHEDGVSSDLFLRQPVLLEPPPQYEDGHGGDGELSTVESWAMRDPPFLPEYYGGGASEEAAADILGSYHDGGGGGGNLFSSFSSSSCSSSFYDHAGDEGLFAMESSTTMQLPASNLSHWDDIIDLVNLELKPPATDRIDHSLTY